VVALPLVLLDQITKMLAHDALWQGEIVPLLPFLNLRLGFNRGISFGLLPAGSGFEVTALIGLTVVIALTVAILSIRTANSHEGHAFALILGGALGNLVDRVRDGMVTDFIDLHAGGYHWPTFNVADVAISLGAAWLVGDALLGGSRRRMAS
jgi:signal peptidase II